MGGSCMHPSGKCVRLDACEEDMGISCHTMPCPGVHKGIYTLHQYTGGDSSECVNTFESGKKCFCKSGFCAKDYGYGFGVCRPQTQTTALGMSHQVSSFPLSAGSGYSVVSFAAGIFISIASFRTLYVVSRRGSSMTEPLVQ